VRVAGIAQTVVPFGRRLPSHTRMQAEQRPEPRS